LIDTASLLPVNRNMVDPAVIGHVADASILVVLTHVTSRQNARRAQKMLESAGSQVAGIVINHREEGQC
jgi:Mrp family chromosome partitioning ATPase